MQCLYKENGCTFKEYIKCNLAIGAAPTLLGQKSATLLSFQKRHLREVESFQQILDAELIAFSTKYQIMTETETSFYVFLYQKELLEKCLNQPQNQKLLKQFGYETATGELVDYLQKLKEHYIEYQRGYQEFPDELGIFLGYPGEDVKAYIENQGKNYLCCGYWKVYSNLREAVRIFEVYDYIRKEAIKLMAGGYPLNSLYKIDTIG